MVRKTFTMKQNIKEKYFEKIRKKVGHTIYKYSLISENDHIMIALSGGKDSLVMLEILSAFRKYFPLKYKLTACHVLAKGVEYDVNKNYLEEFCKKNEVDLFFREISVNLKRNPKKHPCFVCSWQRRKKLFEICREFKCNKLAFGHHMNDAIETLFLNMIYHGSISSLPQKVDFFNGEIKIIRPLLQLNEKDISMYAQYKDLKKELKSCGFENKSKRSDIKNYIKEIEKYHPRAKINIFRSMDNIYTNYLPKKIK